MKNCFTAAICCLLISGPAQVSGQNGLSVTGQIRYRFELSERDFDEETNSLSYNLLRTRIGLSYRPVNTIGAFFQLQDSRVLGEEQSTLDGSADRLDMHQAYLSIDSLFHVPLSIRLGRFEAAYANERLIGAVGWSNIGRSFNGAIFAYESPAGPLNLFGFKIRETLQSGNEGDINFFGLWGSLFPNHNVRGDVFVLWRKLIGPGNLNEGTFGANIIAGIDHFSAMLELAYQTGRLDSSRNISSYLTAVNLIYRFEDAPLRPFVSAGAEVLSGDDDVHDEEYRVFNTLFATNHKFYGIMDFFINIPLSTDGFGLTDIHLGLGGQITENFSGTLKYHHFRSSETYRFPDDRTMEIFGDEIDLILNYVYNRYLKIQAGGGIFFPGDIFRETRGEQDALFFYISFLANL